MSEADAVVKRSLHPEWFRELPPPLGVSDALPGIYELRVCGADGACVAVYIGRYRRSTRPRQAYKRNVINLRNKDPYRKSNPDGFRHVHRELEKAEGHDCYVTMQLIENVVDKVERKLREAALIKQRRQEGAAGGPEVLNRT